MSDPLILTGEPDEWTDVGESPTSPGVRQLESRLAPGRVYREGDQSFDTMGELIGPTPMGTAYRSVEISFPYTVPTHEG